MQPNSKPSSSSARSNSSWRFSLSAKRAARERPLPPKRSDLGSDEEWHFTMGSDSEVDEPEPPVANSNPPAAPSSPDPDPLAVQWHGDDEESFVDDVKQSKIPTVQSSVSPHRRPKLPHHTPLISQSHIPPEKTSPPPISPPPASQPDDQPLVIPGYRGVNSHTAIANHPVATLAQRSPTWADRPRGNPVPLMSSHPPPATNSAPASPSLVPTPNHVEPDSAPSPFPTSIGIPKLQRTNSNRTSSDASDAPREAPLKSLPNGPQPPSKSPLKDAVAPRPSTSFSKSDPSPANTTDQLEAGSRKSSGLRLTIRDTTARLREARLSASKLHHRRSGTVGEPSFQSDLSEQISNIFGPEADPSLIPSVAPTVLPPVQTLPQQHVGGSSAMRTLSNQRLSTRSDGAFPRRNSELAQGSLLNGRPLSTPMYIPSPNFQNPTASSHSPGITGSPGNVFTSSTGSSFLPTPGRRRGFRLVTTPTKDLSYLECVVETLRGSNAAKRKGLMSTKDGYMWLTPNMKAVQYRIPKPGQIPITHSVALHRIKKLVGKDRELTIEVVDQKKSIGFLFQTKERADMWLSALCCLVPKETTVKAGHRKLERGQTYDPLTDTWNGKKVAAKKKLNQFILLGSIGKGTFGKVKLALSQENRQFYAIKVLSKEIIRKKMFGNLLDKTFRDRGSSSPLTIADINEIVVMKALNHRNVTQLKGVFDDTEEDLLYLVLEFLAKGPIMNSSKLWGAERIPEGRIRTVLVDVLCGLQYLHSNNVAHRDIKPENLLQAGDGTVKISDFGSAILYTDRREADEGQIHNTTIGTPAFLAPELCLTERSPPRPARHFAADIWSLGATVYYMVYGCAPFSGNDMWDIFETICTTELVLPETPEISDDLKDLIRGMLKKSPEERMTISSIIRSPWLTAHVEVADKLAEVRGALLEQANGTGEERRRGRLSNR